MSSATESFQQANSLFVDEQYPEALEWYTKAIEQSDGTNAEFFSKQAACLLKLKRYTEAIQASNAALKIEPNNVTALLRKGMACFSLEEFESAKMSLEQGLTLDPTNSQLKLWLRKCNVELEEEEEQEQNLTVAPAQTPTTPTSSTSTVPTSTVPTSTVPTSTVPTSTVPTSTIPTHTVKDADLIPLQQKIRHEWYQTDAFVFISVFAKDVTAPNTKIEFTEDHVSIELILSDSKEFQLDLDVCDRIVPSECSFVIRPTKIEIKLKKSKSAKWNALERPENTDIAPISAWADTSSVDKTSYPTSSKKGPKSWEKIANSEEEDKLDGDAALNKVFQDIYSRGSEEQRRAMMKSFVESNGTVLSTNWEDVGSRTVKGSPPKGMEMHSWDENQK